MIKILFFSVWFIFHPVHVTLTSIDYVPLTESFKVFVRMNFDDLIADCKTGGNVVQGNDFSGTNPSSLKVMEKYLNNKIILEVNNNKMIARLLDLNVTNNEVTVNLIYGTVKKPETITVKNMIMTSLYSDQTNMVIVRIDDFEEGVKLTSTITEKTFKIK